MQYDEIVAATRDVFLVRGRDVNWVILRDGTDLTLVDAGYPGDADAVEASIEALGHKPEDVQAILVTHAHADHLGAVNPFFERYDTPVLLDPIEVPHAKREYLEQVTPAQIAAHSWKPRVALWAQRITRNGATRDVAASHAKPFDETGPLDLPGYPVPVPTHAHTSGHSAFHLPAAGVLLCGDELMTGHALTSRVGPQLLPEMFRHGSGDRGEALDVLARLDADLLLPGHGPLHRGPIAEAVAVARRTTS